MELPPRAEALIRRFEMKEHPEGGWYAEIHRSDSTVTMAGGEERAALTTILFLLTRGQKSRWHRVDADEVWTFLEGGHLELLWITPDFAHRGRAILGTIEGDHLPVAAVPAGAWQAAHCSAELSLVACTVAPGFEWDHFALMNADDRAAGELRERFPDLVKFL